MPTPTLKISHSKTEDLESAMTFHKKTLQCFLKEECVHRLYIFDW